MTSFRKYSFYISILFLIVGIGSCGYGALILQGDGNLTGLSELVAGGFALALSAIIYASRETATIINEKSKIEAYDEKYTGEINETYREELAEGSSDETDSLKDWGMPLITAIGITKCLEVIGMNNWNLLFLLTELLLIGIAMSIYGILIYFTCNQRSWARIILMILLSYQLIKSIPGALSFDLSMIIGALTLAGHSYCLYMTIQFKLENQAFFYNEDVYDD